MRKYLANLFAAWSALGNALLGRNRSLSISGYSHIERGLWRNVVNKLFAWQKGKDHCSGAFSSDIRSAIEAVTIGAENNLLDAHERAALRIALRLAQLHLENQDEIETETHHA